MKTLVRVLAVSAVVSGLTLFAQDEEDITEEISTTEESSDENADEVVPIEIGGQIHRRGGETKYFYTLPLCKFVDKNSNEGECAVEVLKPGARQWEDAVEGKYYPLGSAYRTKGKGARLTMEFGPESRVEVIGEGSFGTRGQALGEKSRAISLRALDDNRPGIITVKLPRGLPEGLFMVSAPGFKVVNLAGDSRYRYLKRKDGDGDEATVRCITGTLSLEGRHFRVPSMHAANQLKVVTSQDALYTGVFGDRGDVIVRLDQGLVKVRDVETGDTHIDPKYLEWKLSPQTAVRIHRAVPEVGENMSVSIMTFDATGALKNRCAFAENRFEINSGELGPTDKNEKDALAQKATEVAGSAAAAETVEADVVDAEEPSDSSESEDDDLGI